MGDNQSLHEKLDRMEAELPLRVEDVDWDIRNPELLHQHMDRAFRCIQRIEQEVSSDVLLALLPNLPDHHQRFLGIWEAQENPHGDLFEELRRQISDEPPERFGMDYIPSTNLILGTLSKVLPVVPGALKMTWLSKGASHEKSTYEIYSGLFRQLTHLGEVSLSETLVKPILYQEAHHLGYYVAGAKQQYELNSRAENALARFFYMTANAPVGGGAKEDKAEVGHAALVIMRPTEEEVEASDQTAEEITTERIKDLSNKVLRLGEKILHLSERQVRKNPIYDGFRECLDAAEREALETAA